MTHLFLRLAPLYFRILRAAHLAERRCAWCGRLLGFLRSTSGKTSHGICERCDLNTFGPDA
jgi:hypothetical protein